ncbi:MAG: hypothetical protein ABEJ60_01775 [Halodesulfurarchaeum sp.]
MTAIEKTRAVVEEGDSFDGRIFPTEKAELGRPVRVRADATVMGSIYGETVETYDNAVVEGSVMASDAIEMAGGSIRGEVGTPGKIEAQNADVKGTVTGKRVTLEDTVVRGNVVGTEIILENSLVLGIVTAERSLEIRDSLCYTFRSQGETSLIDAKLILPQAVISGSIEMETPVKVAGFGPVETESDGGSESTEGDRDVVERLPEMTDSDLYRDGDKRYLSLAPRVLNLEKVSDRLADLEEAIMEVVNESSDDTAAAKDLTTVLSTLGVEEQLVDETLINY